MDSMARNRLSRQELIRLRRREGFIGRRGEIAAFRDNFARAVEDPAHQFLFHVHGQAGVGKTSLVRQFEETAREQGAPTAYVDEAVHDVPEAMAAISGQLAAQGHPLEGLRQAARHLPGAASRGRSGGRHRGGGARPGGPGRPPGGRPLARQHDRRPGRAGRPGAVTRRRCPHRRTGPPPGGARRRPAARAAQRPAAQP
ncbi:ATP-binding protein [Streptomyces platensis]|uniref:ATP-binding protein n=1 Tax=Streptomyces platensis TaxID=58346 RepID=A0AAE6TMQ6_STRPT|nr:ATP-binding protein [Streptomyces platensis]